MTFLGNGARPVIPLFLPTFSFITVFVSSYGLSSHNARHRLGSLQSSPVHIRWVGGSRRGLFKGSPVALHMYGLFYDTRVICFGEGWKRVGGGGSERDRREEGVSPNRLGYSEPGSTKCPEDSGVVMNGEGNVMHDMRITY